VRCFTRNGNNWADRFPSIVEAAARLEAHSFLIDGEVVVARDDGRPDFHALRSRHRCPDAVLYAFDLLGHNGADLRDLPLIERKQGPATLLGRVKVICFNEHLADDGPTVFKHICRAGLLEVIGRRPLDRALACRKARPTGFNGQPAAWFQACAGFGKRSRSSSGWRSGTVGQ